MYHILFDVHSHTFILESLSPQPLLALESRDKNISCIQGATSIEHRDLPLHIQVELLEKALCAAKIELDDTKAELLFREDQVESLLAKVKTDTVVPMSERPSF